MPERVVMLAVDGLDWSVLREGVAAGRLPALARLIEEGAWAEVPVRACVPGLGGAESGLNSPTLWTTVATGQHYFQHGVYDFSNLLDSVERPPLFQSRHVRSPRIWDVLGAHGHESLVVGYYVTHPTYPIPGCMVSDLFGETAGVDACWPRDRADELARVLEARDYATYAHEQQALGCEDAAREARSRDGAGGLVERGVLTRMTRLSQAQIDEVLAAPPDDRRRRLLRFRLVYPLLRDERFHRLFLHLLPGASWRFATVYYRLIDFVGHGFWTRGLTLPDEFVRAYGGVVDAAYVQVDAWIDEIARRLGSQDRLIVLSDHGFAAAAHRAELAAASDVAELSYGRHAEPAVFIALGGAARGRIEGLSLLDVAPSIYDFFGLPQAEALDGGVAHGLLHPQAPRPLPRIGAYAYERWTRHAALSQAEEREVLRRLAALGYVDG